MKELKSIRVYNYHKWCLSPLYFTDKCFKTIRVIKLNFHYLINGGNSKYTDKIYFTVFLKCYVLRLDYASVKLN